jgi:putative ABC transport system substrate-binding protein
LYIARILKGEKPAEMPLQQSVKVEMIVNLKTAVDLGLNVPQSLLARADEGHQVSLALGDVANGSCSVLLR